MYESHVGGHLEQLALFVLPRDQADEDEQGNVDHRVYERASDSGEVSEVDSENLSECDIEDIGGPTNESDLVEEARPEEPHCVQPSDSGPLDPATIKIDTTKEDGQSQKRGSDKDVVDNNWPLNDDHTNHLHGRRKLGATTLGIKSSRRCKVVGCHRIHVRDTVGGAKIYSAYCQKNTCQAPRNENTPFCIRSRDPFNRYCAFHGRCRTRGCTRLASRSEKMPFPYVCPEHTDDSEREAQMHASEEQSKVRRAQRALQERLIRREELRREELRREEIRREELRRVELRREELRRKAVEQEQARLSAERIGRENEVRRRGRDEIQELELRMREREESSRGTGRAEEDDFVRLRRLRDGFY